MAAGGEGREADIRFVQCVLHEIMYTRRVETALRDSFFPAVGCTVP